MELLFGMSVNIREVVEAQVAEKIVKGEALAERTAVVAAAQTALDAAIKDAAGARRDAINAGWTEAELKRLGLANPRTTPRRKPRATN
jgi:hypothetical protein